MGRVARSLSSTKEGSDQPHTIKEGNGGETKYPAQMMKKDTCGKQKKVVGND